MRNYIRAVLGVSLLATLAIAFPGLRGQVPKDISAADQKAITALFRGVDPSLYRLEFNKANKAVGNKHVTLRDMRQINKIRNPGEAAGWIVLIVETESQSVIYVLAVGNSKLQSVLGREKLMKLNQIMAKYQTR